MRRSLVVLCLVLFAVPARAQSPYVAATIGADISRVSHTDSNFSTGTSSADTEVISWSLRVGTDVGQNWGTELEFEQSGWTHSSSPFGLPIPLANPAAALDLRATTAAIPIAFPTDIRARHSDFDAAAWARQRVNGSIDLVYLGGLSFSRERTEISQTFPTVLAALLPVPRGEFRTTTIDYSVRPLAGVEARIALTSHVRLIPGVRLQGRLDGWLLRPYAGLGWFF
jgi:hypothetical protein